MLKRKKWLVTVVATRYHFCYETYVLPRDLTGREMEVRDFARYDYDPEGGWNEDPTEGLLATIRPGAEATVTVELLEEEEEENSKK